MGKQMTRIGENFVVSRPLTQIDKTRANKKKAKKAKVEVMDTKLSFKVDERKNIPNLYPIINPF